MEESEVSFGFTGEHVRRVRVGWVQQWLGECVARGGDCYGSQDGQKACLARLKGSPTGWATVQCPLPT